jgi:hypothetical protein
MPLVLLLAALALAKSRKLNQRALAVAKVKCKSCFLIVQFQKPPHPCFHHLWGMKITRNAICYEENTSFFSLSSL